MSSISSCCYGSSVQRRRFRSCNRRPRRYTFRTISYGIIKVKRLFPCSGLDSSHSSRLLYTHVQKSFKMGIHSGNIRAGVIGQKLPRFRLFGDTINTSARSFPWLPWAF